ncbi:MAG: LD-carboxypeptidase [Polyangiaceae bacterium]|nr:LD-carboxypeptidase [Polyangiaceae bacterium]
MHSPQPLAPGDEVIVVAPSGPCDPNELWRGIAWLRSRYRVRLTPRIFERDGYLAGSDARRASELSGAMLDPAAKAIFAARGGYGAMRIARDLPWREFAGRPKWLVGFSDVTALHASAWAFGVATVHGANVAGLGREPPPITRATWIAALERPGAARVWPGLRVVRGGPEVKGPIIGGNLAVLHALAAARQLALPRGCIVALEDVGEAPYRVDRMLTSLVQGGYFGGVAALVFGGFDRCAPPGIAETAWLDGLVADCTRDLDIPAVAGAPFGHAPRNEAFIVGGQARVSGDEVHLGCAGTGP